MGAEYDARREPSYPADLSLPTSYRFGSDAWVAHKRLAAQDVDPGTTATTRGGIDSAYLLLRVVTESVNDGVTDLFTTELTARTGLTCQQIRRALERLRLFGSLEWTVVHVGGRKCRRFALVNG